MASAIAPAAPRRKALRQSQWNTIRGLLFASPWLIGLAVFWIYPILASFYYSFTEFNAVTTPQWVGFQNYVNAFTQEEDFGIGVYNTLYFAVLSIPLAVFFAFGLALLLNAKIPGQTLYRTIYYLPVLVPEVALSLVWVYIFNPATGLVNAPFNFLSEVTGTAIRGPCWMACEAWSRPTLVLLALWIIGGQIVIYLAGLQDVPQDLYEAASIDGANWWHKFWNVTWPMMTPVVFFHVVTSVIGALQFFTIPFIMTGGTGQPAKSLLLYSIVLYKNAFAYFKMGYASALAWLLFITILAITLLIFWSSRKWVYYGGGDA